MAVHVDEIHTDIVPAVAPSTESSDDGAPRPIGAADDAWSESRRAALMISRRTAAEGFDD